MFENLGFFRLIGSSNEDVRLLAYGAWTCEDICNDMVNEDAVIDFFIQSESPFSNYVSELGLEFTGSPLTRAYVANDGNSEQVFENIVVFNDSYGNNEYKLRPLSQYLNILPEEPGLRSEDYQGEFFPVQDQKGYQISDQFWEYLDQHGGIKITGPPITNSTKLNNQILHQCFVNICLVCDLKKDIKNCVRPEPLGYLYKGLYSPSNSWDTNQ